MLLTRTWSFSIYESKKFWVHFTRKQTPTLLDYLFGKNSFTALSDFEIKTINRQTLSHKEIDISLS